MFCAWSAFSAVYSSACARLLQTATFALWSPCGRPPIHLCYGISPSSYLLSLYFTLFLLAHHHHAHLHHLLAPPHFLPRHQGLGHHQCGPTTAQLFRGLVHNCQSLLFVRRFRMEETKCSGLPMCRAREWTTSAPVPSSPQSRLGRTSTTWREMSLFCAAGHVQGVSEEVHAGHPCSPAGALIQSIIW